jgi:hypothetical protein
MCQANFIAFDVLWIKAAHSCALIVSDTGSEIQHDRNMFKSYSNCLMSSWLIPLNRQFDQNLVSRLFKYSECEI